MTAENVNCEAYTRTGRECSRKAIMTIWHPKAPPASEGAMILVCGQHANSYSMAGWKPWPAVRGS